MRRKATTVAAALLIWAGAVQAATLHAGDSLAAALDALRADGLRIIFSTALIGPDLRVNVEPGAGSAEEIARRILAPHGLALEEVRPGLFSVVKTTATAAIANASGAQTAEKNSSRADDLDEIDIYASRYQIEPQESAATLAELKREELEALPGLDEDVLRVTRFLPGTASNALSARSHVRGGRDDELAVYFDGVPLFEPFHYKDVQSLLGMLDPDSISKIDFFSGVFPVRYGNRLSGVLDITPRTYDGSTYAAVGASLLYTHAISQGELDSVPLQWLVSARRGNVDFFADMFDRREAEPNFIDALGRLQLDIGERSTLVAGWLLLDDELGAKFEDASEVGDIEYRDATGWLSWRFRPSDDALFRATLSRTERHTNRDGSVDQPGSSFGTLDDRRRFDTSTVRLEANLTPLHRLTLNSGLEWYDYNATYRYVSNAVFDPQLAAALGRAPTYSQNTDLRSTGQAYAAFTSALVTLTHEVSIDLALRWDAQRFGNEFKDNQLSPRVSLQYDYDPATTIRLSWGRAAQTLRPDELQVQEGDPRFPVAQRATQVAASIEHRVTPATQVRVELYDKRIRDPSPEYESLLDPFALLPELEVDRVRIQPDRSRIHGAELSARWQLPEHWSGWTNYSYSEATDYFGGVSVPRTWDQKHAIATGLAWTNRPWQLSANFSWHSGWRRNQLVQASGGGIGLEPRNSERWPAFLSLDTRVGWTHSLPKGLLESFFEIDNFTNHSNPCCSRYRLSAADVGTATLARDDTNWLPRVFLLGVTWQLP